MITPRQTPSIEGFSLEGERVFEAGEPGYSKLLDRHGNPIPYESPKQGFMGFTKLR